MFDTMMRPLPETFAMTCPAGSWMLVAPVAAGSGRIFDRRLWRPSDELTPPQPPVAVARPRADRPGWLASVERKAAEVPGAGIPTELVPMTGDVERGIEDGRHAVAAIEVLRECGDMDAIDGYLARLAINNPAALVFVLGYMAGRVEGSCIT